MRMDKRNKLHIDCSHISENGPLYILGMYTYGNQLSEA